VREVAWKGASVLTDRASSGKPVGTSSWQPIGIQNSFEINPFRINIAYYFYTII